MAFKQALRGVLARWIAPSFWGTFGGIDRRLFAGPSKPMADELQSEML